MCSTKTLIFLCFFALSLSLIDAGPLDFFSRFWPSKDRQAASEVTLNGTKLVDLPDDCLYEIFSLLDIDDLSNLSDTDSHFIPVARHFFTKKVLMSIEKWSYEVTFGERENYTDLEENTKSLIQQCTPAKNSMDIKLILLFKFIAVMEDYYMDNAILINIVQPYVDMSWHRRNNIGEFAEYLTFNDHLSILSYFRSSWARNIEDNLGSMCYAYMMVLENLTELWQKQFSYSMMQVMNKIRNAANAYHLLKTIRKDEDEELEYVERFPINWDLYEGKTLSDDVKGKFHLAQAKEEMKSLHLKFLTRRTEPLGAEYFANVYCAIQSLTGPNFKYLVESSELNLATFSLARAVTTDELEAAVKKMRRSLELKCKGTNVLQTSVDQILVEIEELAGDDKNNVDFSAVLLGGDSEPHLEGERVVKVIQSKINNLANATDFNDYIKLLKTFVKIARTTINYEIKNVLTNLYMTYFTFVDRPNAFDNLDQLNEVDKLHAALYNEQSEYFLNFKAFLADKPQYKEFLKSTLKNFATILSPKAGESVEVRTKQKTILKFLIIFADGLYGGTDCEVDDEMLAHISKTVQLFYAIAKLDGYILSQDSCLLTEWKWFNQNLNTNIKDLYIRGDIAELSFLDRPYKPNGNSSADAITYMSSLLLAESFCEKEKPLPDQMLDNILVLEESIGDAEDTEDFLQTNIVAEKKRFYETYISQVRERQEKRDLKKFVTSKTDLLLNCSWDNKVEILHSIYIAILNNKEKAKTLFGEELADRLCEISEAIHYKRHRLYNEGFGSLYLKVCKKILNFSG